MKTEITTYPECYLHVYECRSGEAWIVPLRGNSKLDLEHQLKKWIKKEFGGELFLDGEIMPRLDGDYYGKIMTDNRPPDSIVCWDGGGFYLKGGATLSEAQAHCKRPDTKGPGWFDGYEFMRGCAPRD